MELSSARRHLSYRGQWTTSPCPWSPSSYAPSIFAELHRKRRQLEVLNRQLEQRVAQRTEELRERADLLELASEAIMVRDLNGIVQFWNSGAEELYGWRRDEVVGRNIHDVLRSRSATGTNGTWQSALLANGRWEGNLLQYDRQGREIVVASRQALKCDGNGDAGAVLEINRDITGTLQTEEALRKAERLAAMGRIAGIIAHEINNPLEAIINAFYLLHDHPSLDEEARSYARLGEGELLRVAHIVRQTLGFYRESQRPVQVSIPELLDNVLELQARHLQMNRLTVEKLYAGEAIIYGFPSELKQVFLNLIGNAVQATPEGGHVRLRVRQYTDPKTQVKGVAISICDNGSGIKPEDAKRLFEPFFSTKSAKGTGLGLWISKGIIQKHEGRIQFRSVRVSNRCATCFRIFLPEVVSRDIPQTPGSGGLTQAEGGGHA